MSLPCLSERLEAGFAPVGCDTRSVWHELGVLTLLIHQELMCYYTLIVIVIGCSVSRYAMTLQEGVEEVRDGAKVGGRVVKRFIPFSEGSRDCVGQSLARLNLTTTLAQLFGCFSFRLDESVRARSGAAYPSNSLLRHKSCHTMFAWLACSALCGYRVLMVLSLLFCTL